MSNSYFKFKQFTVHQESCAMKVCTDACIFGAWIAQHLQATPLNKVLDIGTGTGLLSLMVAQKNNATIHGVEVDAAAAKQASQNFEASPWSQRLLVVNDVIQNYESTEKYDFILSNPPFYENDLKSPNVQRNDAFHSRQLGSKDLIASIKRLLRCNGQFALLLPFNRSNHFEQLAQSDGFFVKQKVKLKQTDRHPFFRAMLLFTQKEQPVEEGELTIKQNNVYTPEFVQLLQDYYLYL